MAEKLSTPLGPPDDKDAPARVIRRQSYRRSPDCDWTLNSVSLDLHLTSPQPTRESNWP